MFMMIDTGVDEDDDISDLPLLAAVNVLGDDETTADVDDGAASLGDMSLLAAIDADLGGKDEVMFWTRSWLLMTMMTVTCHSLAALNVVGLQPDMEHDGSGPEHLLPGHRAGVGAVRLPVAVGTGRDVPPPQEQQPPGALDCTQPG